MISEPKIPPLGSDLFPEFEALRQAGAETDRHVLEWASELDEGWLARMLTYTSIVAG